MWIIFKVYLICYNITSAVYVLVFWLRGRQDLSSLTKDRNHIPCI